jgi:aldehyde dehydrogenase (NAD+)
MKKGWFVQPTIFEEVSNSATIAREEIFGPVLSVIRYRSVDEAVAMANDSMYGLGGAVFSRDIPKAISIAKRIRTGTVWINDFHLINALAPFGGYKQSGVGRELGPHGLLEFTQVKHIHVDLALQRSRKFWYDYIFND